MLYFKEHMVEGCSQLLRCCSSIPGKALVRLCHHQPGFTSPPVPSYQQCEFAGSLMLKKPYPTAGKHQHNKVWTFSWIVINLPIALPSNCCWKIRLYRPLATTDRRVIYQKDDVAWGNTAFWVNLQITQAPIDSPDATSCLSSTAFRYWQPQLQFGIRPCRPTSTLLGNSAGTFNSLHLSKYNENFFF